MDQFCLIISGGEFEEIPDRYRDPHHIIACDRGWQYAEKLRLKPDLVVGDFDSAPVPENYVPVLQVPSEKDDTDTMLAARRALTLGYRHIVICCAFGGRMDHTFANIQTGAFLAARGADCVLLGKNTEAEIFTDQARLIERRDGWSLSVFSLTDECLGVTIRGAAYECEDAALTNAFPLGVSNRWTRDFAEITVKRGILMVMRSRLEKGEHI